MEVVAVQGLTRRQQSIYDYLVEQLPKFEHPPTLDELCNALGVKSRGSLHKHIQALVEAGLIYPMNGKQRGLRLKDPASVEKESENSIPFLGRITVSNSIERPEQAQKIEVPNILHSNKPCYALQMQGDALVEAGILDNDVVIVEQRNSCNNGDIVLALIDNEQTTLRRIEQVPGKVVLHPANRQLEPMSFEPLRIRIQGVVVGQMRKY